MTEHVATAPARMGPHAITCPACGGSIAVKAAGYSVSVACQYCGSILDVANPDVKVIEEYHLAAMTLAIPLGTRGVMYGVEWEAIGYLGRTDGDESWDEFLLFNPYAGYRWLSCADGEWQFGTMLMDEPQGDQSRVSWRGASFEADYDPATTRTERVVGEFYWRVRAGDTVQAMTFSGGDQTLSVEWSADETNWTALVDVPAAVVGAAFNVQVVQGFAGARRSDDDGGEVDVDAMMQRFRERAAAGGGAGWGDFLTMAKMAAATAGLILVILIGFGIGSGSTSKTFDVTVDGSETNQTIGTVAVTRPYQFVTVTTRASDFTNRWVDLDYSLVNRQTQQAIEAGGTVEYYAGRDSDGSWTEGSHSTTTKFAGVPRGTYDIVVDASAHAWKDPSVYTPASSFSGGTGSWSGGEKINLKVDAKAGGVPWSNFFASLFALFGGPALMAWLRSRSE